MSAGEAKVKKRDFWAPLKGGLSSPGGARLTARER